MSIKAAVIDNNIVTNIIVIDDIEQSSKDLNATLVEFNDNNPAILGWTYDETTGKFNPPVQSEITE